MSDARTLVDAIEKPHGFARAHLAPWDLSGDASTNDRELKLGKSFDGSTALAIYSWNEKKGRSESADGLTGESKSKWTSYGHLEPDNWVYRPHSRRAKNGKDNTWDLRLSSDRQNKDDEREHRSTMVIDQCHSQTWAWVRDALGVVKINGGTPVSHEELYYDGAGQLTGLKHFAPKEKDKRGTLALMISKTAGYISDYLRVGQLWHVLSLPPAAPPGKTQVSSGGCGDVLTFQGALRGDVPFHVGNKIAPLHIASELGVVGRDAYMGHFVVADPSPVGPAYELNTEADKSNQPQLPRWLPHGLRPVIKISQYWVPVVPRGDVPSGFPSVPTLTAAPAMGNHGVARGWTMPTAVDTGYLLVVPIPEQLEPGQSIDFRIKYGVPAAGWGGQAVEFQVDWCAVAKNGGDLTPAARTGTSGAIAVNSGTADGEYRDVTNIPYSDLQAKKGGNLFVAVYRNGTRDTYAGSVIITGFDYHFGKAVV